MASRQNHIIIGGLIVLVGVLMLIFGKGTSSTAGLVKCPFCAELIQSEAIKCKHCGSSIQCQASVDGDEAGMWGSSIYYRYENGEALIADAAIEDLVKYIRESRNSVANLVSNSSLSEQTTEQLKQKFAPKVSRIADSLPIEIQDKFWSKYKSLI